MGRMEDFSESKVLGMADVFGGTSVELGGNNATRNDNGLAYISPTVNGLHVAIAGYALDSNGTAANLGTEVAGAGTDDINDIDATDIAVMYSNGPLAVNIAQETTKDSNAATNNDEKITSFGVGYTMGDLKVSAVYQDIENAAFVAADDHNDTMLTAVYSMGNNSIALGWNEDELTTGATDNNTTALELRHNFSARTRAYVGMTQDDFATAANETDTVYMGLEHSF
jgi:predicted porin